MSMIRRFSDIFIPSCSARISIYVRSILPLAILIMSILSIGLRECGIMFVAYCYCIVMAALSMCRALSRSLQGLALPFIFIAIGFAMHLLTRALGFPTPSIPSLVLSSFKLALVFLSITLFFQWVNLREIKYILARVGLGRTASYLSIAFAIMPMLFNLYSESYTAALLKFGRRKVYKAVKPLVIQAAVLARDIAQAIYLYGIPTPLRVPVEKPSIAELLLLVIIVSAGSILLALAP